MEIVILIVILLLFVTVLVYLTKKAKKEVEARGSKFIGKVSIPYILISIGSLLCFALQSDESVKILLGISAIVFFVSLIVNIIKYRIIGIWVTIIRALLGIAFGYYIIAITVSGVGVFIIIIKSLIKLNKWLGNGNDSYIDYEEEDKEDKDYFRHVFMGDIVVFNCFGEKTILEEYYVDEDDENEVTYIDKRTGEKFHYKNGQYVGDKNNIYKKYY